MSAENVRDMREILASIEALNEEADLLNRTDENEDNAHKQYGLPASLSAEISARKADVVLLDDVYRKGTSQHGRKTNSPALAAQQKTKSWPEPELKSSQSDAEFDQMLSTLVKDMDHRSKKTGQIREPILSATGHTETRDSHELSNLKADIDGLLSPYLNSSAEPSMQLPLPASKYPYDQKSEKQMKPQRRDSRKDLSQTDLSDASLLSAIMTDEIRVEIADYILAEIKQQISSWIAENLENIVEDALRSVSTEARDALKARSVS